MTKKFMLFTRLGTDLATSTATGPYDGHLPPHWRRRLHMGLAMLGILLGLLWGNVSGVYAQTNEVISLECWAGIETSLQNEIRTANEQPGPDVIEIGLAVDEPCDIVLYGIGVDHGNGPTRFVPITDDLTIRGNGAVFRRIDSEFDFRFFESADGVTLTLENLTLHNGRMVRGGAVYAGGSLHVNSVLAEQNQAQFGGAFYAKGELSLRDSYLIQNVAIYRGGAAFGENEVHLDRIQAYENRAPNSAIGWSDAAMSIYQVEANQNQASNGYLLYGAGQVTVQGGHFYTNTTGTGAVGSGGNVHISQGSMFEHLTGRAVYTEGSLVIEDATFAHNSSTERGGALFALGSVEISRTHFLNNQTNVSYGRGGAIYAQGSVSLYDNTVVQENITGMGGGGIYSGADVHIYDSRVEGNRAADGEGGGIFVGGHLLVSHALIAYNEAEEDGGGAYVVGGITIRHATFARNRARDGYGGAINARGAGNIEDSEFVGNEGVGGGALYLGDEIVHIARTHFTENKGTETFGGSVIAASAAIEDSSFVRNSTTPSNWAGAVYIAYRADLQRNLFDSNQGGQGAAIFLGVAEDSYVINNLFVNNRAAHQGEIFIGIPNIHEYVTGRLSFYHNTVIGSRDIGRAAIAISKSSVYAHNNIFYGYDQGINLLGGNATSDGNLFHQVTTPLLQIPGGAHDLVGNAYFTDADNGNYTLRTGSPAIDSGIQVEVYADYAGVERPQGAGLDRGAYEYISNHHPIAGLTIDYDGPVTVGEALHLGARVAEGDYLSYHWELGDGTTAEGQTVAHYYSQPGTYTVRVTAQNEVSNVSAQLDVSVREIAPEPDPTPDPAPSPQPGPAPDPTPDPQPDPTPDPTPDPQPSPDPEPSPTPEPQPSPAPDPTPDPQPSPEPEPSPTPEPVDETPNDITPVGEDVDNRPVLFVPALTR